MGDNLTRAAYLRKRLAVSLPEADPDTDTGATAVRGAAIDCRRVTPARGSGVSPDRMDKISALIVALGAALRRYGQHEGECNKNMAWHDPDSFEKWQPCSCGLIPNEQHPPCPNECEGGCKLCKGVF